jgi:mono/diheme cytochrome c family protein
MRKIYLFIILATFALLLAACAPDNGNDLPQTGNDALPGTPGDPELFPGAGSEQLLRLGEEVYINQCAMCHGDQGEGTGAFPALANNPDVLDDDPSQVIAFILHGRDGSHAFGGALDDEEAAGLVSYIRNAWGNQASMATAEQVTSLR